MQPQVTPKQNSNWKNIVIISLSLTVFILAAALLYDKNKSAHNLTGFTDAEKTRIKNFTDKDFKMLLDLQDLAAATSEGDGEEIKDEVSANGAIDSFVAEIGRFYNTRIDLDPPNLRLTRAISFDLATFMGWAQKVRNTYHPKRLTVKISRYTDDFIDKQFQNRPARIGPVKTERLGRFTFFLCACKDDGQTLATDATGKSAPMLNLGHLYP